MIEQVLLVIFLLGATMAFIYILVCRRGKSESIVDDMRGYYLLGTGGMAVMALIFLVKSIVE